MVSMADKLFGISNPQLFRHLSDNFHGNNDNDMDNSFMNNNTVSGARGERKPKLTRSGIALSTEQKMHLIDYISERPQIWNTNSEGFRHSQARQSAFTEVAQLLSNQQETYTRNHVQEEWGKLRYCFTRIVKKLLEEAADGCINEEQIAAITWPYWQRMSFLLESVIVQLKESLQATGDGQQNEGDAQENAHNGDEFKSSPHKHRRRRGPSVRGNMPSSRKASLEFQAVEEPSILNQSTNDLLMSSLLAGLSGQDVLLANQTEMSNSLQLLNRQFNNYPKQETEPTAAAPVVDGQQLRSSNKKKEYTGIDGLLKLEASAQNKASINNFPTLNGQQTSLQQNVVGINEQQMATAMALLPMRADTTQQLQQQLLQSQRVLRRKRRGTNLECLLQQDQQQHEPSLPTKTLCQQSPTRTIADSIVSLDVHDDNEELQQNDDEHGEQITASEDINEAFGRFIVQQLQTVAKKNEVLSVQMRKELVDVCFKYEMRSCKPEDIERDQ